MRRCLLVLGVALLGASMAAQSAQAPRPRPTTPASTASVLPFAASERTLPNGLRLIVVPTGFPDLVSVDIGVRVGSRNEVEPGKSGFAHLFEHLLLRGTTAAHPTPDYFRDVLTRAGARSNGTTGDDLTHYYATFAKESLDEVMAAYADVFQHLAYTEADFKTEVGAVLGEYNKGSAEPFQLLFEAQRNRAYDVHPYKHTTIGFIRDIERMPEEYAYSKRFFDRWYRPQFTTVIVAGDVMANDVATLVERRWGAWPGTTPPQPPVPPEPAARGPRYVHVPWPGDTLPIVTVAFRGPAFDERDRDTAAVAMLAALYFGPTSDLYRKLVVTEQRVQDLGASEPRSFDPSLFTVVARVKRAEDTPYVRDQILAAVAQARAAPIATARLRDAQSYERYSLARRADSSEQVVSSLVQFVAYRRAFDTVNRYHATLAALTPGDVQAAARRYFTTAGMVVATLAHGELPRAVEDLPTVEQVPPAPAQATPVESSGRSPASSRSVPSTSTATRSAGAAADVPVVQQRSALPLIEFTLQFSIGSAHDPLGKEGLAALTASMIAEGGSVARSIEAIQRRLYPIAGSFESQVDKEMTVFTGRIHRDQWGRFARTALPQLTTPGFRPEDFARLMDAQVSALTQELRSNNEEELGKERLQTNLFRGTPYGHAVLGTEAGLRAVTLADVRAFATAMYTKANLTIGVHGDASAEVLASLRAAAAALPAGTRAPRVIVEPARLAATEVEIIQKDTRATAISFGHPIAVTRAHPDYPALFLARAALGEHREFSGRLMQTIRLARGLNYGDYAYIEAFPGGMFTFFPPPSVVRQRQIFEIWIRPLVPATAHMTLRLAVDELDRFVNDGLTADEFQATRDYLLKNVAVMTARQHQQLGYALDARWYGTGEFVPTMRTALAALTLADVNAAIRRHLSSERLSVVIITKDATALREALVSDAVSVIAYDSPKSADVVAADKVVGSRKLGIAPANVRITPVSEVFAR